MQATDDGDAERRYGAAAICAIASERPATDWRDEMIRRTRTAAMAAAGISGGQPASFTEPSQFVLRSSANGARAQSVVVHLDLPWPAEAG